jgi:hypothetical protein
MGERLLPRILSLLILVMIVVVVILPRLLLLILVMLANVVLSVVIIALIFVLQIEQIEPSPIETRRSFRSQVKIIQNTFLQQHTWQQYRLVLDLRCVVDVEAQRLVACYVAEESGWGFWGLYARI